RVRARARLVKIKYGVRPASWLIWPMRGRAGGRTVGRMSEQHIETAIVGGGQAGLATAYHLTKRGRPCLVLESGSRVGDSWRDRWPSLRLYSPARYDGLPGMRFPAPRHSFPSGTEM